MLQLPENEILQQETAGLENNVIFSPTTISNMYADWNLTESLFHQGTCNSSGKDFNMGSYPYNCPSLQTNFTDPSWNMGYQFNGSQYSPSACYFLDQGKRLPELTPQSLSELESSPFPKDYVDTSASVSKQGSTLENENRMLNYVQTQNAYNSIYSSQEPPLYSPYNAASCNNSRVYTESDYLDKFNSPLKNSFHSFSSCMLDQAIDIANIQPEPLEKITTDGAMATDFSSLMNLAEPLDDGEDTILRVNESDDESDIIVEDSETESEISIDVGPYIDDKVVDKAAVMRCFVCNLSYSERSEDSFVQVNSSFPLTFISQTPVMLKLIEIIPTDMQTSVKFENNLICRRCLNLIDTIENLEIKLVSVKKALCDFVSRSGKDGEDDLSILPESNDLCLNLEDNAPKEVSKNNEYTNTENCVNKVNLVTTGVNTDIDDSTAEKISEKQAKSPKDQVKKPPVPKTKQDVPEYRKYQCDKCGKMYKREKELIEHLDKHAGKFAEKCPECGKGFYKLHNLELHMRKHREHVCLNCRASFNLETDLTDHLLVCVENKFICDECTLPFNSEEKLKSHFEKFHQKKPNYSCNICSKSFKHPSSLEAHLKSHSDEKPFACEKCGLKYKNPSHLRRHQRSHDLPFHCTVCRAMFPTAAELQWHSASHSDKLKCDECDKVFVSRSNLVRHKSVHTGNQNKKECPVCKKLIVSNFIAHVESHAEEKKYKCDFCDSDFTFKQSMMKHIKKKHPPENHVSFI